MSVLYNDALCNIIYIYCRSLSLGYGAIKIERIVFGYILQGKIR